MKPKNNSEEVMSFLSVNANGELVCDAGYKVLKVVGFISDTFGERFIMQ